VTGRTGPRLLFLGTGGAANEHRNQACLLVLRADPALPAILLDTGNGLNVVRSLLGAGVDPLTVQDVFVSHRHPDHSGGLDAFLGWRVGAAERLGRPRARAGLRVHTEPRTRDALLTAYAAMSAGGAAALGAALQWVPLVDGQAVPLPEGQLVPFLVDHLPVNGGAMGCLLEIDGVRIVYSGDTRPSERMIEAARGADLLVHECGGLDRDAEWVHRPCHSTAGDAGRVAMAAGVGKLVLTHISNEEIVLEMQAEAEAAFDGPAIMAEDGMSYLV
jgi:ribonuclease BN (tRNA processing enzyme)